MRPSSMPLPRALLVVDVQRGMDDPAWGRRDNLGCERNIALLLAAWRERELPIVLVRHDSEEADSPLRPDRPGNALKELVEGPHDLLVRKSVSSAFYGSPDLAGWLQGRDISAIAICGIQTNMCCESTARQASNLAFDVQLVLDATHTFDAPAFDGGTLTAEELARATATNLEGELADVISTSEALRRLDGGINDGTSEKELT